MTGNSDEITRSFMEFIHELPRTPAQDMTLVSRFEAMMRANLPLSQVDLTDEELETIIRSVSTNHDQQQSAQCRDFIAHLDAVKTYPPDLAI